MKKIISVLVFGVVLLSPTPVLAKGGVSSGGRSSAGSSGRSSSGSSRPSTPKPTTPKSTPKAAAKPTPVKTPKTPAYKPVTKPYTNSAGQRVVYHDSSNWIIWYLLFFSHNGETREKCYDSQHKQIDCKAKK